MNDAPYRTPPANDEPAEAIPNFHVPRGTPTRWRFVVWAACLLISAAWTIWNWMTWAGGGARTSPTRFEGYLVTGFPILFAVVGIATVVTIHLDALLRRRRARRNAIEVARLMSRDSVRDPRATVRKY
ncbi:MAG TPA: hypothetical protein VF316_08580 [Polyangiaceae bacterium]